jgi:YggT family protein
MGYFGGVLAILLQVVFGLVLFLLILRVVLPLSGARFKNPLCQLVYKATNPVLGPLGRAIPNWRRLSLAGVLLCWLIAALGVAALLALAGQSASFFMVALLGLGTVVNLTLAMYFWAIIVRAVMSFFSPDYGNPAVELLNDLTEPVLKVFRKLPPRMRGLDLSPLYACVAIRVLQYSLAYVGLGGIGL